MPNSSQRRAEPWNALVPAIPVPARPDPVLFTHPYQGLCAYQGCFWPTPAGGPEPSPCWTQPGAVRQLPSGGKDQQPREATLNQRWEADGVLGRSHFGWGPGDRGTPSCPSNAFAVPLCPASPLCPPVLGWSLRPPNVGPRLNAPTHRQSRSSLNFPGSTRLRDAKLSATLPAPNPAAP